jgi:hypothetical protein
MFADLSDDQIKTDVMYRLLRKNCWGAKYLPLNTLVNWIGGHVKMDGKRVRGCVDELNKDGHLIAHKKGETISLNPARSKEILDFIERNLR